MSAIKAINSDENMTRSAADDLEYNFRDGSKKSAGKDRARNN